MPARVAPTLAFALTVFALAPAGCDAPDADFGAGEVALRPGAGSGGIYLNTNLTLEVAWSELDTTGAWHDGVRLVEVQVYPDQKTGWVRLDKVWSAKGQLRGRYGTTDVGGAQLLNSRWKIAVDDPTLGITSLILTVKAHAHDPVQGLHKYSFDYLNPTTKKTGPTCSAVDAVEGYRAVAYEDIHVDVISGKISTRPDTIYFGCISGAVGKAATWGYKPYDASVGLGGFQTAVRVVRADYCGDGLSWTKPGNPVQLRDVWGENDFVDPKRPTEAIWDAEGALCLHSPRWDSELVYEDVVCGGEKLKECAESDELASFYGAQIWSKRAP